MSGLYRTTRVGAKRSRTNSFGGYSQSAMSTSTMNQYGGSVDGGMSLVSQSRRYERKKPALRLKGRDKRVAKIARAVASRIVDNNIEVKYQSIGYTGQLAQTSTTAGPVTVSGHLAHTLTFPGAGTGSSAAIGDKIRLKYINYSIKLYGQTQFMNPKNVKFILAQFNGPAPSGNIGQVLNPNINVDQINGGTGAGTVVALYDFQSLRNVDQGEQVKVLYEKELVVDTFPKGGNSSTQVEATFQSYQFTIPMYNRPFEQASGTTVNHVYVMYLVCDSGEKSSVQPTILGLTEYISFTGLQVQAQYQIAYQDA